MSQTIRNARQIIGREREQAALRALALAARDGAGALVLLGGEAGIGKTALVEALGREASAVGLAALTGHCYDLSATPPYGPWLETGLFTPVADDRRLTPERQRILDMLRQRESVRPTDLAAALDLTTANAAQALHRLHKLGLISKTGYGTYERARSAGVASSQSSQGLAAGSGIAVPPLQALSRGEVSAARGHAALFKEIRDYLGAVAARQPLVIILEDLHWADPISLELLRFLARQVAALPVLLVATYRDDALTRRHPLYQLLPLLVREAGAQRLDLRPLDEAALRALTATRYDLPPDATARLLAYLARRAGGNPSSRSNSCTPWRRRQSCGARARNGTWATWITCACRAPCAR
jgi:predicted ATPase